MQVVTGPRQVGKSTLVQQVTEGLGVPFRYTSADEPTLRDGAWIAQQWEAARLLIGKNGAVLVLDEIQKIPHWSDAVKRLWDEDTRARRQLKVVLLGSAPLLITQGLTESLAGRFELLHLPHWSFSEMHTAFGWSLDEYLYFGGYPGAAPLVGEPARWARYICDSLIDPDDARADREFWGRLTESAVGSHLASAAAAGDCSAYYWRERNHEVDFVVKARRRVTAIEVKSGRAPQAHAGTAAFTSAFKVHRTLLVGGDAVPIEDFLAQPVEHWVGP